MTLPLPSQTPRAAVFGEEGSGAAAAPALVCHATRHGDKAAYDHHRCRCPNAIRAALALVMAAPAPSDSGEARRLMARPRSLTMRSFTWEPSHGDEISACADCSLWHANTGNGFYGGLQQDLTFWRRYGGLRFAARPDLASKSEQITVAERGFAVQGAGAWPICGRFL